MSARAGGRDARQKLRSDRSVTFMPSLERGLPYIDLLSPDELLRLHDYSMQILEEIGIEFRDDEAVEMWRAAGASVTGQRIRIDRNQLMELVAKAPEYITIHARNPAKTVTIGGRKTIFTPAYGSPNVLDLEGKRRNSTIADFVNFAKLAYQAPSMHMTGGVLCEPMDIAVPKRHLHMNYSLIKYSDKPFMGAVTSRERAEDTVTMAKIVFGEEFVHNNTVIVSIANCNSPLVWDATMLDSVKVYAASNQAILFTPFVLAGASTPASTLAAVAQLNAEALAGIAFAQLVRPGAPAIYGQWLATVSMKSGAPMAGTPEIDHMNMLVGQLARHYKLPWRCSGSCTSSKLVDAQAGYEAARNMYGVLIAGANFVLSSTGYLEGALTQSYSKFMLDAEQMVMFYKLGQGLVKSELDETMDAIRQSEPGGHYLGTAHTLKNFEQAFFVPELMDHDSFEQWSFAGARDANTRGRDAAVRALKEYQAPPLDEAIDEQLLDFMKRRELDIGEAVL
ncbi:MULTISPECIES: trimethylamine methyltransferase family protein [unclassified Mesorhizobium]|uniref:trimethylamine methyltransferase family protein n=1 Tax=unclassified Mesorhizobium TaxID=325217 RepID=UPI0004CE02EF|nr:MULTISPECIES: trimethylamine methyltransferase family protein [unclassified Mesorhizobium]WJI44771.1 trimethylamine methyltransferase family protein [Mesorhizobium sp. C120A]